MCANMYRRCDDVPNEVQAPTTYFSSHYYIHHSGNDDDDEDGGDVDDNRARAQ